MTARYIVGDVRAVMATMPDASVDLLLCSPPFLALRSYLPADHPDKGLEIGSEANPAAFIDVLLGLTAEWRRILAPHGSIVIELGDTYSGSGGAGGDYNNGGWREGQPKWIGSANGIDTPSISHRESVAAPVSSVRTGTNQAPKFRKDTPRWDRDNGTTRTTTSDPVSYPERGPGWPLAKSLALVPELYRIALAYGINPLTGSPSPAGRWRVRNVVRWVRPNPPVGALGDKFRPATSDLVVACTAGDRWFDLDAVRSGEYAHPERIGKAINNGRGDTYDPEVKSGWSNQPNFTVQDRGGPPPLDWWKIADDFKIMGGAVAGRNASVVPPTSSIKEMRGWYPCSCGPAFTDRERHSSSCFYPDSQDLLDECERLLAERAIELLEADPGAPSDWWQIVPGGYSGAHYAVWPAALCERPIEAMCPRRVCKTCGKPSRRITTETSPRIVSDADAGKDREQSRTGGPFVKSHTVTLAETTTVGWSSCGCPNTDGLTLDGYHTGTGWRPGIVLDPFAGSGTTLVVAHGHSRDSIGIDLDPRNAELAAERLGMFLEVETREAVA